MDPLVFEFKPADFDLKLLTADVELIRGNNAKLKSAIQDYLRGMFKRLPGEVRITSHDEYISVRWVPQRYQDIDAMMDLVIGLLNQRAFTQAEPILRTLFFRHPDDYRVLFNLGMMLSDQGRLGEACEMLSRLTRIAPDFANGWNALGVALARQGNHEKAVHAFQKSLKLDPDNAYTLRNFGALIAKTDPGKALAYLKQAAELLPSDQAAQYGYGQCLIETGNLAEADRILKKAVGLNEYSHMGELCREARTKIAHHNLRAAAPGGLRMDVVMYCLGALEKFKKLGRERIQAITFEIAMLGRSGLNINDPNSRYHLKSLQGEFTALELLAYMYVGLKDVAPQMDAGIDFSREYEMALQTFHGEAGEPKPGQSNDEESY